MLEGHGHGRRKPQISLESRLLVQQTHSRPGLQDTIVPGHALGSSTRLSRSEITFCLVKEHETHAATRRDQTTFRLETTLLAFNALWT